mmetsp:Transcript_14198/g.33920  ORF Transcript_14198/g.33920 Transcript_14198/m.33920 type:complete len:95 (+) Transcript_14198:878-1162(+)
MEAKSPTRHHWSALHRQPYREPHRHRPEQEEEEAEAEQVEEEEGEEEEETTSTNGTTDLSDAKDATSGSIWVSAQVSALVLAIGTIGGFLTHMV